MKKKISDLKEHKLNQEIYGEEYLDRSFVESIENKGILVPLTIKKDGTIISGHRRYKAAKKIDKEKVPVTVKEFENELAEKEAILTYNSQREKTFKQKMREAEKWEEIERKKAQKRKEKTQLQGKDKNGNPDFGEANVCMTEKKGKTRDKIAKKIKIGSGETYRKAKKVWDKRNEDKIASLLVEDIDEENTSISAAYERIKLKEEYIDQFQDENILDEIMLRDAEERYIKKMADNFTAEDRQKIMHILKNNPRKTVKSTIKDYKREKIAEASKNVERIYSNEDNSEDTSHNKSDNADLNNLNETADSNASNKEHEEVESDHDKEDDKDEMKDDDITSLNIQKPQSTPTFSVEKGDWWALGDHYLYCGDTASDEFKESLKFLPQEENTKDDYAIELSFADPPYNVGAAEWDEDFEWNHDYLTDIAKITAITPGIESIKDFLNKTEMPYKWSIAAWIKNGMTRGKLGYGNWIFIALFSENNIYQEAQDHIRITVGGENRDHKGQKPSQLITELLDTFTNKDDIVLDPFLGSGTTLLAAEEMDRICIGGEIGPKFCRDILLSWTDNYSAKPEKINEKERSPKFKHKIG